MTVASHRSSIDPAKAAPVEAGGRAHYSPGLADARGPLAQLARSINQSQKLQALRATAEMINRHAAVRQARIREEEHPAQRKALEEEKLRLPINDDEGLEREADAMGASALGQGARPTDGINSLSGIDSGREHGSTPALKRPSQGRDPIQRVIQMGNKKLKSRRNISQLWRAHAVDNRLNLEAKEKENFRNELILLAQGTQITEFSDWEQAYAELQTPKMFIQGDDGVVSIIRNTTDLMIWLGSYPLSSTESPKSYAEAPILNTALNVLRTYKKTLTNSKVWRVVAAIAQDQGAVPEKYRGSGKEWGELELVNSVDLMGKENKQELVPGRYRRKLPDEEYQGKLQELRQSLAGYKLVGFHATTMENAGPLVQEGISASRFNTGHGAGKGQGFYFIPGESKKTITSAKGWGGHVVAVFLPESAEEEWAEDTENVQTLEQGNVARKPLYYLFGSHEAVIPPSLCGKVKIVVDPADISVGDKRYPAERYGDEFQFLDSL
jgi:hypothetical protein